MSNHSLIQQFIYIISSFIIIISFVMPILALVRINNPRRKSVQQFPALLLNFIYDVYIIMLLFIIFSYTNKMAY